MKDYQDLRRSVIEFINSKGVTAYDMARITKDLCACKTCAYYVQHYLKDGREVDFGHCTKGTPKSRRPDGASCGQWKLREEQYE